MQLLSVATKRVWGKVSIALWDPSTGRIPWQGSAFPFEELLLFKPKALVRCSKPSVSSKHATC